MKTQSKALKVAVFLTALFSTVTAFSETKINKINCLKDKETSSPKIGYFVGSNYLQSSFTLTKAGVLLGKSAYLITDSTYQDRDMTVKFLNQDESNHTISVIDIHNKYSTDLDRRSLVIYLDPNNSKLGKTFTQFGGVSQYGGHPFTANASYSCTID